MIIFGNYVSKVVENEKEKNRNNSWKARIIWCTNIDFIISEVERIWDNSHLWTLNYATFDFQTQVAPHNHLCEAISYTFVWMPIKKWNYFFKCWTLIIFFTLIRFFGIKVPNLQFKYCVSITHIPFMYIVEQKTYTTSTWVAKLKP